ncbi:MAG: FMN phosphatase YigB, HAD superfamily [Chloroflexi bacterium]|jgi:2-haloalkanoic acid dehalogenase type II|nr:MAG: FMN phosphatase YigB, HAD superfamily [Chloroflexota bacterium]
MKLIEAVVFDMYGTLVENTSDLWMKTFDEICVSQGLSIAGSTLWDYWKPIEMQFRKDRLQADTNGRPTSFKTYREAWRNTFERSFEYFGGGDPDLASEKSILDQGVRDLFPEARNVLQALRGLSYLKIGLLSNADNDALIPLLNRHDLSFDAILTSETAQSYKPTPEPFYCVAEMLGVSPEACIYVGDTQLDDVLGGHNVGMKTAMLTRDNVTLDSSLPVPDYQLGDLNDLLKIVNTCDEVNT